MFERFTDRARKVMALANQEAVRLNHEYIGPEHILLGLVNEDSGAGVLILRILNLDIIKLRQEIGKYVKGGPRMVTTGRLPHTPLAKNTIEYAIEEARLLNHKYLGTEHLLLGLMRENKDSIAYIVLTNLGLTYEQVRNEVLKWPANRRDTPDEMPDKIAFERFTDRTRKVLAMANQEAQRLNHEYIGTEHILLGLVKDGSCAGASVLRILNVDMDFMKMRHEIEKLVKSNPSMVTTGRLPRTPAAGKAIEYAIEEARILNHNYIGTEHLLLGLMHENEGNIALVVLKNLGLKYEQVRNAVLQLLGKGSDTADEISDKPMCAGLSLSERARKILSLANKEAQQFNHESVDTEHILLGFIKEGSGVGITILKYLNVDIIKLRRDVEKLMIKGPDVVALDKPQMEPRAKKVVEYAIEVARSLGRNYVGSEHILLGLMYETKGSISAQVLKSHGLQYEQVRNEIIKLVGG
jgi:ATP-dependent Clp protease ATP-binding subunit ClpA